MDVAEEVTSLGRVLHGECAAATVASDTLRCYRGEMEDDSVQPLATLALFKSQCCKGEHELRLLSAAASHLPPTASVSPALLTRPSAVAFTPHQPRQAAAAAPRCFTSAMP